MKPISLSITKEVLFNIGDYENVKVAAMAGTTIEQASDNDTDKAMRDLADVVNEAIAREGVILGAKLRRYGLE